jgi:hypothetical protein
MTKILCSFVPKDSKEIPYHIGGKIYKGKSTIEALCSYYLSNEEDIKVILIKPETIDIKEEIELRKKLISLGVNEDKIITQEIPMKGFYENKYYDIDNTIIADFIFLTLNENTDDKAEEVILDVSRGINFLVLTAVDAFRRFIVAQKARYYNKANKLDKLEYFYVYLTPKKPNFEEGEISLEKASAPFFFDFFTKKGLPFNFEAEKLDYFKEFNFTKNIISHVNSCITAIKRGFALAYLTFIPWSEIKDLISLSHEKLSLKRLKELVKEFSYENENQKKVKFKMNYPLGNLWIYVHLLNTFYEIYKDYENQITYEENRKWVPLSTLKNFNEKVIKKLFQENSASIILSREINDFEQNLKKGEINERGRSPNYERNFNAHAGLIYEFIDQNPQNFSISYRFNEILDETKKDKIEKYIKYFLKH